MDTVKQGLQTATTWVREHPGAALALTNAVTAFAGVYAVSEGKPFKFLYKKLFQAVMAAVPASVMDKQMDKVREDIEKSLIGNTLDGETRYTALPAKGLSKESIMADLDRWAARDNHHWQKGKVSGCVYHGGQDLSDLMSAAYARFALSNPLHPDVFPAVRKMEAEVVAMTLSMFNGGPSASGCMTSGGTESILMAMKAYRDLARKEKGITEPEVIAPVTAHAAFDKACAYFGIKLVHMPVDQTTFTVDPAAVAAAITKNTVAIVGSAPAYAQGIMDPIEALGALASSRGIPLHVDCCLGSFVIAMAEAAGYPVPLFDFRVKGVTSISADTHKYGFAPKGSSVLMYSDVKYRHAQYFVAPEWTGGIYASPTIAGSRPGALVVGCWATMMAMGAEGYVASAKKIISAARTIAEGIKTLPYVDLCGTPLLSVVAFKPKAVGGINIYQVGDAMTRRGWNLNTLQNPAAIHLCVTYANADKAADFLVDLREALNEVATAPPGSLKEGSGAIYGLAASIPDKSIVAQVAHAFLDTLYKA